MSYVESWRVMGMGGKTFGTAHLYGGHIDEGKCI